MLEHSDVLLACNTSFIYPLWLLVPNEEAHFKIKAGFGRILPPFCFFKLQKWNKDISNISFHFLKEKIVLIYTWTIPNNYGALKHKSHLSHLVSFTSTNAKLDTLRISPEI